MTIKKLSENFEGTGEVKGFEFRQIHRGSKSLLYEVYSAKFKHFEVFSIKHSPVCLDFEKRLYSETDFKETYPKAKDFGVWAWTTKSLDKAIDRMNKINSPFLTI